MTKSSYNFETQIASQLPLEVRQQWIKGESKISQNCFWQLIIIRKRYL